MRIKLKRKTITILAYITSIVAYAMFVWIDWRLAVAMLIFEMSNVFTEKIRTPISRPARKRRNTHGQNTRKNCCNILNIRIKTRIDA